MKYLARLLALSAVMSLNFGISEYFLKGTTVRAAELTNCKNLIVIEAESFSRKTTKGSHSWELRSSKKASNNKFMRALPDIGTNHRADYISLSPRLDFDVNFVTSGTYYAWVRGFSKNKASDSVHMGFDGVDLLTTRRIDEFTISSWSWSNLIQLSSNTFDRATINVVSPGEHTLNIWMREDGFKLDKIVLTTDSDCVISGIGPLESVQISDISSSSDTTTNILANSLEINPTRDLGLATGENVCFKLKSYNNTATSNFSDAICSKIPDGESLTLTWESAPGDIVGYYVYFGTSTTNAGNNFLANVLEN